MSIDSASAMLTTVPRVPKERIATMAALASVLVLEIVIAESNASRVARTTQGLVPRQHVLVAARSAAPAVAQRGGASGARPLHL
mmetsp:Transcript_16799/g.34019  ORF Transcript_16799/g.34019 Transcript_16799/m.34019 type:complete len:84 (-) Transcript_16799:220-471(-)